jgi:hypothetical protein
MSRSQQNTPRKPATKFPQLQKKLRQLTAGNRGQRVPHIMPNVHQGRRGLQQRHG